MMLYSRKWERITPADTLPTTFRMKVPGGWLVADVIYDEKNASVKSSNGITFVPDPMELWTLDEETP